MIGSGEERAKYQQFVKDFSAVFEDSDSQSEADRDMYNVSDVQANRMYVCMYVGFVCTLPHVCMFACMYV